MKYQRFLAGSFFIFFIVSFPFSLHAKTPGINMTAEEEPVDIEADQLIYDKVLQLYQAHGDVNIVRGNLYFRTDHAQLNMTTKDLVAWGNITLREGEDVVECERLEVNLDTRNGKLYHAKLFLKDQNFHISGQEAEKIGENRYRIREGSFTTCDAQRPPWKFTMRELDVTLEGFGIAKGNVFYLGGVPVIYLPIGIFPVRLERQTGFLFPRIGYSKKYGPEIKNAFFWAISKDMDATLYFDRLGDGRGRGFKEGLEYRYALTQETKGQANFNFIDDQVFDKNRYAFFLQHQQNFFSGFYLKGDINHVSDHKYTHDFDEDLPEGAKIDSRSMRQLRSTLFGGKNWDQFTLLGKSTVFEDLTKESNDETVQELPKISFYAHPQSLFKTPFFYDVTSSYVHFWREKGVEAHRGDFFPRVSYPVRLFNVIKLESDVQLRETAYRSYNDPARKLNHWKTRETFEVGTEISTEFFRVYDGTTVPKISNIYKVAKWMHTIEPMVSYRFSPHVKQEDISLFDEIDRISYTNQITYGITQRLLGKPKKEDINSGPYEYGKLRVFQNYSFGDPFQRDEDGRGRYFSNIQAELWWNFNPYLSAQWDTEFNPYEGHFDRLNALLQVKDQRNDVAQIQYRNTKGNIKEVNFDGRVKIIDSLYIYTGVRYNLLEKMRVENIYGAQYQAQCWILGLTVEDKNRSPDGTQSKELKFEINFSLLGIGSMGHKAYLMNL